jgi:sugar/nucleoside kinase (ribokinase family)
LVLNHGELEALGRLRQWPIGSSATLETAFELLNRAGLKRLVVTCGEKGVRFMERGQDRSHWLQPQIAQTAAVRDVSGAGDAFCAALAASYLRYPPDDLSLHVRRAMRVAELTVLSEQSVSPAITPDLI